MLFFCQVKDAGWLSALLVPWPPEGKEALDGHVSNSRREDGPHEGVLVEDNSDDHIQMKNLIFVDNGHLPKNTFYRLLCMHSTDYCACTQMKNNGSLA